MKCDNCPYYCGELDLCGKTKKPVDLYDSWFAPYDDGDVVEYDCE